MATPVIIEVKANTAQAKREIDSLGKSFNRFGANVRSLVATSSQAVTGIRQMAQGLQNLGFVLSAMIGIPATAAFKAMSDEVLSFERAMVEVQKTTGLATRDIKDLSDEVRDLAKTTPTSAQELANLAAEAGRAGVGLSSVLAGDIEAAKLEIMEFVRVVDMMQVSTTLTGETASQAFGRFMSVFKDIDTTNLENLGSAINELGQSASVSEDEIVGAMMRIAPAAATLGIAAQDVAALATAITQTSESMSRGGTRVRSAIEQMVDNWDLAAKLIGADAEEMSRRLNEDALQVFLDLIYAIGEITDNTEQMTVANEIFGTTGSNAVQRLGSDYKVLAGLLNVSNTAFNEGTSLQVEFNRALGATVEQLKVLKNNIIDVALIFAEDLLPIAKDIIGALIPAVRELGEWVKGLDQRTKLLAVAIAGLVIVGLPLLALFGSFGFAFSMMLNGVVNLVGGLTGLLATVLTLGSGASFLSVIFGGLALVIGTGLAVAVLQALEVFDNLLSALRDFAKQASEWGGNLIIEFAGGIISAATTALVKALEFVGSIVSMFLEGQSPPPMGPLSTIDKWGKTIMDTYLQGFKNADFGILRDVTSTIRHIFESLADIGKMDKSDIGPALAEARMLVSKLIDRFNRTGEISEEVLGNIKRMLGEAGDEVATLLRLQLEYNKAVEELDKIRQRQSDIEEQYDAEIRAIQRRTDLTGAEKLNMIRQARGRRNIAMDVAKTEESAAQKNVDSLKDQLDWQKEYIEALKDTDKVWQDHIKSIANGLKKLGKAIKDVLADLLNQLRVNKEMQDLYKSKDMDTTPLLREELNIRKRIVKELIERNNAIEAMENPSEDDLAQYNKNLGMIEENLSRIKELEAILDTKAIDVSIPDMGAGGAEDIRQQLEGMNQAASEAVAGFQDILSRGTDAWEAFKAGIMGKPVKFAEAGLSDPDSRTTTLLLGRGLADDADPSDFLSMHAKSFYEWGQKIGEVKNTVVGYFQDIIDKWHAFQAGLAGVGQMPEGLASIGGWVEATGSDYVRGLDEVTRKFYDFGASINQFKTDAKKFASETTGAMGKTQKVILAAVLSMVGAFILLRKPLLDVGSWFMGSGIAKGGGKGIATVARNTTKELSGFWDFSKGFGSGLKTMIWQPIQLLEIGFAKLTSPIFKAGGALQKFANLGAGAKLGPFAKVIAKIGKVFSKVGAYLPVVFGWFTSFFSSLVGGTGTVAAFAGIFSGLAGVIVAVGVVIAGIVDYMVRNWNRFKDVVGAAIDNIKEGLGGFVDAFKSALGIGEDTGASFQKFLEDARNAIEPIVKLFSDVLVGAIYLLSDVAKNVLPALGRIFGAVFAGIAATAKGVIDIFAGVIEFIEDLYHWIASGFSSKEAGEGVKDAAGKIWLGIKEIFYGIFGTVLKVFAGLWEGIFGIIRGVASSIGKMLGDIPFISWVIDLVDTVIKWFQDLYNTLVGHSIIPDLVNGIIEWINKIVAPFKKVFEAISKPVKKFFGFMKKVIDFIRMGFKKGGMAGGLKSIMAVLQGIFGTSSKVFTPIIDLVWRFWKVISPVISALTSGFKEGGLAGAFEALKEILPLILPSLLNFIGSLMTVVPKTLIKLGEVFITKGIPAITNWLGIAWEWIAANAPAWWEKIKGIFGTILTNLWNFLINTGIPTLTTWITAAWEWIKSNAPGWWQALSSAFASLLGSLWGWVTSDLLPWLVEAFTMLWGWIVENAPGWWDAISTGLGIMITNLWTWITETLLPWAGEFITSVFNYLVENLPDWISAISTALGDILKALGEWIVKEAIPKLGELISLGVTELGRIATEWLAKVEEALDTVKEKFGEKFEAIGEIIKQKIKDAINGLIGLIEKGVNNVITKINALIREVNKIATAVGLKPISLIGTIELPRLARGGIALAPTLAMIGERGAEAVIPLSKLETMINGDGKKGDVIINVNDPVVRSDDDIQRIIQAVKYEVGLGLQNRNYGYGRGIG